LTTLLKDAFADARATLVRNHDTELAEPDTETVTGDMAAYETPPNYTPSLRRRSQNGMESDFFLGNHRLNVSCWTFREASSCTVNDRGMHYSPLDSHLLNLRTVLEHNSSRQNTEAH